MLILLGSVFIPKFFFAGILDEKSCYFISMSQFEGKAFIPFLLLFAMWLWENYWEMETIFYLFHRMLSKQTKMMILFLKQAM